MLTKQHFITNLISCLQIWVPRPSWPDPTRPAHPSKYSDPTRPVGRVKDRATLVRQLQTWHGVV